MPAVEELFRRVLVEAGQPCGDSFISDDKECKLGQGDPGAKWKTATVGKPPLHHGPYKLVAPLSIKPEPEDDDLIDHGPPKDPPGVTAFAPGDSVKSAGLNGVGFAQQKAPVAYQRIKDVPGLDEQPFPALKPWQHAASGVVVMEPDGRVWVVAPKGGYGGYDNTFPKGTLEDDGLTMQQSAHREVFEESGLRVRLKGVVGDFAGDTSVTRYYLGERIGGSPYHHDGKETAAVKLATPEQLRVMLNKRRDRKILAVVVDKFTKEGVKVAAKSPARITSPATDALGLAVAKRLADVNEQWLAPVRPVFAALMAKAKDRDWTDADFIAAVKAASEAMPTLFDRLDTETLAEALEETMGAAMVNGAQRALARVREEVSAGEAGGIPCGDSFISGDKVCRIGEGKPGAEKNAAHPNYLKGDSLPPTIFRGMEEKPGEKSGFEGGVYYSTSEASAAQYGTVKEYAPVNPNAKLLDLGDLKTGEAKAILETLSGANGMSETDLEIAAGDAFIQLPPELLEELKANGYGGVRLGKDVFLMGDQPAKEVVKPGKPAPKEPSTADLAKLKAVGEGLHPSGLKKLSYVDNSKWTAHSTAVKYTKLIAGYEAAAAKGDSAWLAANPPGQLNKPADKHDSWDKKAVFAYQKAVAEAAKAGTKAAEPHPDDVMDSSKWKKVGGQLGSNPGGLYEDGAGKQWYVKHSKSDDHARNEVLAAELYKAAGSPVLDYKLVRGANGKLGTATPWQDKAPFDASSAGEKKAAVGAFATHAWLGNWDAVGLSNDNQAWVNKTLTTLDTGGALRYRAQGEPKPFGEHPTEWQTLRDPAKNPQSAAVFGGMTVHQQAESAAKVAAVPDAVIDNLVKKFGPTEPEEAAKLATTLKVRKLTIKSEGEAAAKQAELYDAHVAPNIVAAPTNDAGKAITTPAGTKLPPLPVWPASGEFPQSAKFLAEMEVAIAAGDVAKLAALKPLGISGAKQPGSLKEKLVAWQQKAVDAMENEKTDKVPAASVKAIPAALPPPVVVTAESWKKQYQHKFDAIHAAALKGDADAIKSVPVNPTAALSWAKKLVSYKAAALAALGHATPASLGVPNVAPAVPVKQKAAPPAPAKPVFDPAKLPAPPTFTASSVKAVNDANNATVAMLHDVAKAGDKNKLLGQKFDELDKATGKMTGNKKPFSEHPSTKVSGYYNQLSQNIDEQLNPPPPPPPALHATYVPEAANGVQVDKTTFKGKTADAGRWLILDKDGPTYTPGSIFAEKWLDDDTFLDSGPGHKGPFTPLSGSEIAKHSASKQKLPIGQQNAVSSYMGSSYDSINSSLASGSPSGGAIAAATGVFNASVDLPEGKWLSRNFALSGKTAVEMHKVFKATEGHIVQDPVIASTATSKDMFSNTVKLYMRVGPGAKGLRGVHDEDEIMLPPNTRMAIDRVKMVNGKVFIFAVLLPTLHDQCCDHLKALKT